MLHTAFQRVPLLLASSYKRLGILFSQQRFEFLIQPFSIQRYPPVLWNHPECMVYGAQKRDDTPSVA